MLTRRTFLSLPVVAAIAAEPIDRRALVMRHHPIVTAFDPLAPLSVGNGEFAFTADPTGLQTFPAFYEKSMPLCTQSQWGWHSNPLPPGLSPDAFRLAPYDTFGRPVGYPTSSTGQKELFDWLRENPHRLHLGRIGFDLARPEDVSAARQELVLWDGILRSRFRAAGQNLEVETACHSTEDLLAVRVRGRLPVVIEFPAASSGMSAADWSQPARHTTAAVRETAGRIHLRRTLDADTYYVTLAWEGARIERPAPHRLRLVPTADSFAFVCRFTARDEAAAPPAAAAVLDEAAAHWNRFWQTGGAIDLAGSQDRRARELERRIVLSQYLTAIQCAGSLPPQETGLTCNSWYGKFHLEMHWWHAAHFPLWGRAPLLERSLAWYERILPAARRTAQAQGYAGARWPKMTSSDGRDSPSPIGPLLIWQQPHPIAYAELCYRAHPGRATLERYREIVQASAEFMADFAHLDPRRGHYVLGPPVIPAQENHPPRETWNPTFELEYWDWGLRTAQEWRRRLGQPPDPRWDEVRTRLAPLPVRDGVYLAHENCPQTYTERNRDHPSMLAAFGVLPGAHVDKETMRRTLRRVFAAWRWDDTWGWDYPMTAMTAARLGEPALAVDALLMDTPKNRWLPNGHNYQRPNLPLYLPGNGGLLTAAAMMAAAWQGFPRDTWSVRWEGLLPLL